MAKLSHATVGDIIVFYDGFPAPYPYVGVVEAVNGDRLTFRGLEVKTAFTRPISDFHEATDDDKRRVGQSEGSTP